MNTLYEIDDNFWDALDDEALFFAMMQEDLERGGEEDAGSQGQDQ